MSINFEPIEYTLPEWALSAIFNGDTTGLSDDDERALEAFLNSEDFSNGHWAYPEDLEAYFSHSNDVDNLGGNVVDVQFMKRIEG